MDQRVQKTRAQPNKNVESLFSDSPNPFQDTSSWKKAEITPIDFGAGNFSKGTTQQTNEEPDEWDIDYQFKNAKVESNPFKAAESRVVSFYHLTNVKIIRNSRSIKRNNMSHRDILKALKPITLNMSKTTMIKTSTVTKSLKKIHIITKTSRT